MKFYFDRKTAKYLNKLWKLPGATAMDKEHKCPRCNGAGEYEDFPHDNVMEPHKYIKCPRCKGTGNDLNMFTDKIKMPCKDCNGMGDAK